MQLEVVASAGWLKLYVPSRFLQLYTYWFITVSKTPRLWTLWKGVHKWSLLLQIISHIKLYCCPTVFKQHPVTHRRVPRWHEHAYEQLYGEQCAILLEYLDRKMLLPDNATDESMVKAIQYLERKHELSLLHGDIHQFMVGTPCNMMFLKNGDIEWIDSKHSQIGAQEEELEFELGVVKAVIGLKGLLWEVYLLWYQENIYINYV